jgi:hypothetical protein
MKYKIVIGSTLIGASIALGINLHNPKHPVSVIKPCSDWDNPCYQISMPDSPTYRTDSYKHIGTGDCIDFTSIPDNGFHGYCGDYKIERINQ